MHLATLWQWPGLTPFHSSILTPNRAKEQPLEQCAPNDFEDTCPAFVSFESDDTDAEARKDPRSGR
jgi:hypothetical protein